MLWRTLLVLVLLMSLPINAQVFVPTDVTNPCNPLEGSCDASGSHNRLYYVNSIGDAVTAMQDDLHTNWFQPGFCGMVAEDRRFSISVVEDLTSAPRAS